MMNSKGVVFDLDGVIVDTAKFHYLAWRKLANELGFDISEDQNEHLKGVSRERSLEKILKWGNVDLSEDQFVEQMRIKNENYLTYIEEMNAEDILPGVTEVIEFLKEQQIPIALGSASKNARIILEKTGLHQKFTAVVDGNDVKTAKPDPEVFLLAASQLNVEPENCIVFEDSQAGVEAANRASMVSVGIGDREVLKNADYVFSDFNKVEINFLEKLLR